MKKLVVQGLLLFGVAGSALASGAAESGGGGFLIALFLGFFAVIVVFQLIPSLMVFFSVVKEIFAPRQTKVSEIVKQDEAK
ncbi:hypothetical protein [Desulfuromonas sp. TF]|uniref:hypothetical protein n=1 Tax=Desulfuromonas sp. TF TaxID=1232410 RepID=UPI0004033F5E|nr:hypothetical protein [Desulfuromonas sp. TF]